MLRMAEEIAKLKEEAEMQRQEISRCKMELSFPSVTLKSVRFQHVAICRSNFCFVSQLSLLLFEGLSYEMKTLTV